MLQRLLHLSAVIAIIASSLFGGDRAVLCITEDGAMLLHTVAENAAARCDGPQSADCQEPPCFNGKCIDLEIRSVAKRPASTPNGIETLSLPVHPTAIYLAAMPLPASVTFVSGRSWSQLHSPPAPAVADITSIRQI